MTAPTAKRKHRINRRPTPHAVTVRHGTVLTAGEAATWRAAADELRMLALAEEGRKIDPDCDADTRHWLTGRARVLREAAAALAARGEAEG